MSKFSTLIGKRFGDVVVTNIYELSKKAKICVCKCDCGREVEIMYGTLTSKRFKGHCGCKPHKGLGVKHHYTKITKNSDKITVAEHSIRQFMSDIRNGKYDYIRR